MEKSSIPGYIIKVDITDELVMFMDEVIDKEKRDLNKDVYIIIFHYLVQTIFNTNNWTEVEYETASNAICTIDDTIGKILSDVAEVPEEENQVLASKLSVVQKKLTLDSTSMINAISKSIITKIYTTYNFNGQLVTLLREDDLTLMEVVITYRYDWVTDKTLKKATITLNLNN